MVDIRISGVFLILILFSNPTSAQNEATDFLRGVLGTVIDEATEQQNRNRIEDISNREERLRLERIDRNERRREQERLERENEYRKIQQKQELQRQAEERKRQRDAEQQAAQAAAEQVRTNNAMNEYLSDDALRPCISGACIGMTIDDILALRLKFVDGPERKLRIVDQRLEEASIMMGRSKWELAQEKQRVRNLRKLEIKEYETRALSIKGISPAEQKYVAQFIGSHFDTRALELYNKAALACDYFDISAMFYSREGYPIRLYFAPFGRARTPLLALIEVEYDYGDSQLASLEKMVSDQYAPFNILLPYDNLESGNFDLAPDVVLAVDDDSQHLFLIDRRVSFYFSDRRVRAIRRKIEVLAKKHNVDEYLASQDGCKKPISLQ